MHCERLDSRKQMAVRIRLQKVTTRSSLEQIQDQGLVVVHREDENLGPRQFGPNLPRCLDAVEDRQRIVDDGDIGVWDRRR